jgi:hypothetical protein
MKRLFVFAALVFALTVGTMTVMTVHSQQAFADPGGGGSSSC